jgi:hypothetical protein
MEGPSRPKYGRIADQILSLIQIVENKIAGLANNSAARGSYGGIIRRASSCIDGSIGLSQTQYQTVKLVLAFNDMAQTQKPGARLGMTAELVTGCSMDAAA